MNFFGGFFQKKTTKGGKPSTMKAGKRKNRKTAKKSKKSRKSRKMKGGEASYSVAYPQPEPEKIEEFTEHPPNDDATKKQLKVVPVDGFKTKEMGEMTGGKKGGNVAVPVVLAAANFMGPKKAKKGGKKSKTNKRRRH